MRRPAMCVAIEKETQEESSTQHALHPLALFLICRVTKN